MVRRSVKIQRKVSKHQKTWAASGKSMLNKGEMEKLSNHVSSAERACPRCQTVHAANLSWNATSQCVSMHGGEQGAPGMLETKFERFLPILARHDETPESVPSEPSSFPKRLRVVSAAVLLDMSTMLSLHSTQTQSHHNTRYLFFYRGVLF